MPYSLLLIRHAAYAAFADMLPLSCYADDAAATVTLMMLQRRFSPC